MQSSAHFDGKVFVNPIPTKVGGEGNMGKLLYEYFIKSHPNRYPAKTPGPFSADLNKLNLLPPDTLRVTWLGHSGLIIEIDGKRILTDPVYRRASPFQFMGPKRFFPAPIALDKLPHLDAIIISHDHYDHLDQQVIVALATKGTPIYTSLGVGAILQKWGISQTHITEMDWWQTADLGDGITLTSAPARHFSGRSLFNRNQTLWASFGIKGPVHNVYYGADSGMHPLFNEIGERLGPFDLAMLEVGAADPMWADIHMGPANATNAMLALGAKVLMPIHWGTFNLALHTWTEPVEDVMKYAAEKQIKLLLPAPGQTYTYNGEQYINKWWEPFM
ncbi:MBL fold metallo-hydrolase [Mucilaginibacter sp. PPCGB 2223]|uniref:MBL fold metallo-hydrolase n=1 Tax=Mucilaginibacter sp. PPCGB 2223 TaxID=1886027 RepID=UPI000825A869|nr:MBL fold metallo-hydrolase [Mucilaginibacter sp. PPCGB 2223]OCX52731.1 MBL fold metallo-hydrolase [Mucilaginibacter sp. PPCGB 2223]